jgi:hypothetical protein
MPLVIFDRQHKGRSGKRANDRGCSFGTLVETDLTEAYIAAAKARVEAAGVSCEVLTTGEYPSRQAAAGSRAKSVDGRVLYIACHVNAGRGTYALVEYDDRSANGKKAAAAMAAAFDAGLVEVTSGRTVSLSSGDRGFACVSGIYAGPANVCAVLVEPGFIDASKHASLWTATGLVRVGNVIADAALAWVKGS